MKVDRFESEYNEDDVPVLAGSPMSNSQFDAAVNSIPTHERVDTAQQNLVMRAVSDFYFAKYFHQAAAPADYEGDTRLAATLARVSLGLRMQAVVSIATTIDLVSGRTASLPHMLDRVEAELTVAPVDATAELALIEHIRSCVDRTLYQPLMYVYYLRNKWAAHSSLDLQVDTWAKADGGPLNLPLLEAALVRVVNAFDDFAMLQEMSEQLLQVTEAPPQQPTIDASGVRVSAMTVA